MFGERLTREPVMSRNARGLWICSQCGFSCHSEGNAVLHAVKVHGVELGFDTKGHIYDVRVPYEVL